MFGIYSDAACGTQITNATTAIDNDEDSATNGKAIVSFTIEFDNTYYIKEITAPKGYMASDKVSAADTSVPSDTPNGVNNPETGVVLGTAGTAILSGIICVIASKGAQRRRKRKNGDNNKIDF